jgi:hypothetical protein
MLFPGGPSGPKALKHCNRPKVTRRFIREDAVVSRGYFD